MEVPFFRYPHVFSQYQRELLNAFTRVSEAGAFILQTDVSAFEEELAAFVDVRYAIGVSNATDGLELVFRALGIGGGDEVILPSHTFVASAAALVHVGAKPVFAEIGADHLLEPADVEQRIGSKTRAIMPTQLNGRTANMDRFFDIAEPRGLIVLEDSAQGLGSRFKGRMAGTFAPAGMYSFYPAKTLGALGDAGAVVTNDADLAQKFRRLRDHGRDAHGGGINLWGRNSRLDNLQAAFLRVKLPTVNSEFERRRAIARIYHEGLSDLVEVVCPPSDDHSDHFDVFQNYELEAERRDDLRAYLADKKVGTILQWGGKGVHQFAELGAFAPLPRTEAILGRSLLLPMNTSLTDAEASYVVESIRRFYERM